ncbi:MAG TPA: flagellar basal body protein, partial [Hyphomonas sp.]|nr:flagellar basal body protein [Hyphomonas sp.]
MDNALLLSLSKQMVMRRTMDIIANNLANMNTTAFKRESVLFESFTVPVESVDESGNATTENLTFVRDYGVVRDLIEG